MNNNVTAQEVSSARSALQAAGVDPSRATRGQIRDVFGVGDRRARTIKEWIGRSGENFHTPQATRPDASFDSAYAAYKSWIGVTSPVFTKAQPSALSSWEKLVIAGDFHSPFHLKEAVQALIEEEAGDTDTLVLNGDLGDFWATSRFPKSKRVVGPCEELAETQALLTLLASRFKRIKVVGGNHDERPQRFLTNVLPPDVLDYIKMTGPMVFEPLKFMSVGLENVEVVEPIHSEYADFGFFYQHGDLVCTHAEKYTKQPGKTATDVLQWVKSFAEPQGILRGVRCLIQAHSHHGGTVIADFGCMAIDGGCLSSLQDYHGTAKIFTPRPLARGWTVAYQENGRTSFRDTRFKPFHA